MHETTNHVLVLGVILRRVLLTAILGDKQKNVCLKGLCYRRDKKYWCYLNEDRITLSTDTDLYNSVDILQQPVTTSQYQDAFAWFVVAC